MTEQELVQGCRNGERHAQRTLYDDTADRIYRLVLRMTRNPDDAFDVTQETFVRAFTRMEQFDGRSSLATWLYRIAVNETLQFLRRRKGRRRGLNLLSTAEEAPSKQETSDRHLDLESALEQLGEADQAVLLLRYQEGLDYRQIAQALECEAGTVGSRLNRARGRLRALLADYEQRQEETGPLGHHTQ
ncbi:MAG: RNA polymerase sigma factor [Planctomycetota bacterium]